MLNPQFDLIREDIDKVGAEVKGVGNEVGALGMGINDVGKNVGGESFHNDDDLLSLCYIRTCSRQKWYTAIVFVSDLVH
jgi:hypothetical protein